MQLFGYSFDGPHSLSAPFNDVPGVYLVLDAAKSVVDVGQTDKLGQRIPNHDRKPCWQRSRATELWFAHEQSERNRLALESVLRNQYSPKCGIR